MAAFQGTIKTIGDTYQNLFRAGLPRLVGLLVGLVLLPVIGASHGLRGLAFYAAATLWIPLWFTVTDFGKTTLFAFELKSHFGERSALISAFVVRKLFAGFLGGQATFALNLYFGYISISPFSYAAFCVLLCSSTIGSTLGALLKSLGSQFGDYAEIISTRFFLLVVLLVTRGGIEEFLFYMSALYFFSCLIISYRLMKIVKALPESRSEPEFVYQPTESASVSQDLSARYLDEARLKAVLSAGALTWVSLIFSATTARVSKIEADVFLAANRVIQICCLPATVFISAALLSRRDSKVILNDLKNKMFGALGIAVLIGSTTVFVGGNYVADYLGISQDLHEIFVRSLRVQAVAILPIYHLYLRWADVAHSQSRQHEGLTRSCFALTLVGPSVGIFFPNHPHWFFTGLFLALLVISTFDGSRSLGEQRT